MNDLEQRLRDSLQARANDVEATPHLWEDVQRRVRRRDLRTVLTWASGVAAAAAAVVAAVVVVPTLLDAPAQDVTVDPVPSEISEPTPEPSEDGALVPDAATNLVVATDREINLTDLEGNVLATLASYPSSEFEGRILSVAVSPRAAQGELLVAFTVLQEGNVELRIVGADNQVRTIATTHVGWDGLLAPQPVWSPDGSQLGWIDTTAGEPVLAVTDAGLLQGSGSLGTVPGLQDLQLQEWTAPGSITAISNALQARSLVLADGQLLTVEPLPAMDGAVLDVADTATGDYTLLATVPDVPEAEGDAEGTTVHLFYAPDGQNASEVQLPEVFSAGTASPYGIWLDAHGETAVVGWGGLAWLVSPNGTPQQLPEGIRAADLIVLPESQTLDPVDPTPTPTASSGPSETPSSALELGPVGPALVLTETELSLVVPDGATRVLMDWPDDYEFKPARAEVRPGSTVDDLIAVILTAGEGETELGWVEVRGGEVLPYQRFPDRYQMQHPLDGASVTVPLWSPDGAYLAWIEELTDESYRSTGDFGLRIIGWSDGPGTGSTATDNTSFGLEAYEGVGIEDLVLDQWIWNSDDEGMLTFRYARQGRVGTASSTVGRQPDGAITYDGDAVTNDGILDEALTADAIYRLVRQGSALTLTVQQPGGESQYDLPDGFRSDLALDLPPAAGPYLDAIREEALLLSPDQKVWHVAIDGTFTALGGSGVRDLDPID